MIDEIFDRTYQAGRADLNAGIERGLNRLGESIGRSFEVLHRIQWSAPWERKSTNVQCG
ncbi:MAG TPA: hypothetical protein VMN38_05675 [Sphingomicrobium sp.]|nr:hypothetical protein [Sphingomicrobium sp.]